YTVTDNNGCTASCSVTINEPSALSASCSVINDVSCNGGTNGAADVQASGGTPPYTGTGPQTGLAAGTYSFTVTDSKGCTSNCSVTITEPTLLVASCSSTDATCNGSSDGSTTVTASGGTGPYTGTGTTTGLVAGTYTYTVTDNNGCTASCTATVNEPALLVASCSATDVSCNGGNNGTTTVTASGGTAPYTGTGTTTGLVAGTYTYTVTDNNGCTATCTATVNEPALLVASCSGTDVSCNGGSDGTATVTASGGTAPYTGTGTTNGLVAGTYTYTVTDNNGCTASCSVTINEPSALSASCSVINDVSCNGGTNGSADVQASGGTPPYSGTGAQTGLAAGSYTFTVTDSKGCTSTCSVTINEPAALSATATATDASCQSCTDGSVSLGAVSGGTPPYIITPASPMTGLAPGNYCFTITDNNGCSITACATVGAPGCALVANCSGTDVTCNGGSDGSASVSVTGAIGSLDYLWSNGGTGASATGLAAGTYSVTVTDLTSGCTANCSVTINEPAALVASCSGTDVSCNGGLDGSATVSASGGTAPYSGTGTFSGLAAGTYTYSVTDNNGCTASCTVTINEPAALVASCSGTDISCNGANDGTATVTASGGTAPYTGTGTTTGLAAGTYTYTVTDNNGCTASCSVTINEPSVLTISAVPGGTIQCFGGTVAVTVTGSGGTPPYTGEGTFNQGGGSDVYTVTDAHGCTASTLVTLTEPTKVEGIATAVDATCGQNDGSVSVTASGGAGNYTYLWSPGGGTTSTVTGLGAGTYTVTITDANGCTGTASATVGGVGGGPGAAGPISGSPGVCRGQNGVVYSIAPVPFATSYIWTLPSGATGTSTTESITVDFDLTYSGGFICVTPQNSCGQGTMSCINVLALTVRPLQPGPVSGPQIICGGSSGTVATYSIAPVINATSYNWVVTGAGVSIASGQGTTTVDVNIPAGFGQGSISVAASNCVGNSQTSGMTLTGVPIHSSALFGPGTVCANTLGVNYFISNVNGTTGYTWTTTGDMTVVTSSGPSCVVDFGPAFNGGTLSVTTFSVCGSFTRTYTIKATPNQPGGITGPFTSVCSATGVTYSIAPVAGATSYIWTLPAGVTPSTPLNGTSITVDFAPGFSSGTICVAAINGCGTGTARCGLIKAVPGAGGAITGPASVCKSQTGVGYSIAPITGASSYIWSVTGGASIAPGGTSATVNFNSALSSVAVIKVNGVNSCGYGSPGQKVVSVNLGCRTTDDELSSAPVLSAYPNPTHGILTVNFTASSTARYVVKVTDLLGNVVVSDVMNAVEGLNMTDLNLGKVAKGMYLLSLETDGADAQTMRIVVE
ncbi:MAG: T9SS type A sorting domain-containing protein, partial [Bacteroidia bacterium]|nr:T9SS type A sorting domain-containing protein [Bacteroidia bacterium]